MYSAKTAENTKMDVKGQHKPSQPGSRPMVCSGSVLQTRRMPQPGLAELLTACAWETREQMVLELCHCQGLHMRGYEHSPVGWKGSSCYPWLLGGTLQELLQVFAENEAFTSTLRVWKNLQAVVKPHSNQESGIKWNDVSILNSFTIASASNGH